MGTGSSVAKGAPVQAWDTSLVYLQAKALGVSPSVCDKAVEEALTGAELVNFTSGDFTRLGCEESQSSELAAALETAKLLPPPREVQLWLDAKWDKFGIASVISRQGKAAVPWLKRALVAAGTSPLVKSKVKELLRVEYFTANLEFFEMLQPLQAHCRAAALAIGAEMRSYFEREGLGASLGQLLVKERSDLGTPCRQDSPAIGVPLPPRSITAYPGDLGWERVCTHVVRLVASGVDEAFQAIVEEITLENHGEFRTAQIKGHARIMNKAQADHCDEPLPRPALNIDINRNACTFDEVPQLVGAVRALERRFGTASGSILPREAARVKNMFAFDDARAAVQFDYRTMMLNWTFEPGWTYAELATRTAGAWDEWVEAPPNDPNEPWSRWHADAAKAVMWLRSTEVADKPVRMICETQLLLRPYLEGRLKMHLLYKVVRAESAVHLFRDFNLAENLPAGTTYTSWQAGGVGWAEQRLADGEEAAFVLRGAAHEGRLEAVRHVLRNDVRCLDSADPAGGRTSLWLAAFSGHASVAKELLEMKASVDQAENWGATPLHQAVNNGHTDIVELLLEGKADANKSKKRDGATPLYASAQQSISVDAMKLLLENKAEVNKPEDRGQIPIHIAASRGNVAAVRLLVKWGSDLRKTDTWGKTAHEWAAEKGFEDIVELLRPS